MARHPERLTILGRHNETEILTGMREHAGTLRLSEGRESGVRTGAAACPLLFSAGFCLFSACGIDPCSPSLQTVSAVTPVTLKTRVGPPTTAFYRGCFGDEHLFRSQSSVAGVPRGTDFAGKLLKKQRNKILFGASPLVGGICGTIPPSIANFAALSFDHDGRGKTRSDR